MYSVISASVWELVYEKARILTSVSWAPLFKLSNFDLFGDVCNKSWLRYVLVFFFFNTKFHLFGICVSRLGLYIELVYLEEKGNGK
jgi:hypothetical protein